MPSTPSPGGLVGSNGQPVVQYPAVSLRDIQAQESILQDYITNMNVLVSTLAQVVQRSQDLTQILQQELESATPCMHPAMINALGGYLNAYGLKEDLALVNARRQLAQFEAQLAQVQQMKLAPGVVA